jgi:hypothetical protein
LDFASRTENRVVFRVSRVAKTLGFCMSQSGTDPRQKRRWDSNYQTDVLKRAGRETRPKQPITP